ncbi:hypothetical protein B296_00046573 [Ensete ventricosum]|uniref:Uncharacterized protein n=1 Tax=Ensete ventricosum TaxID=4639 RepID=A0A426YA34_ENSVE|nr:hypothetical protein B296_00046573 [Ensete ventricosum]
MLLMIFYGGVFFSPLIRGSMRRWKGLSPLLGWFLLMLCLSIVFGTSVDDACGFRADDSPRDGCSGFSASLCFPSTLTGFGFHREDSCRGPGFVARVGGSGSEWRPAYVAAFKMADGGVVSCRLVDTVGVTDDDGLSSGGEKSCADDVASCVSPLVPDAWMRTSSGITADLDSGILNGSSSPNVEVSPPLLEWGENTLYTPSIALLTVKNTYENGDLHVHEPFSTDPQYYAFGFRKLTIAPGESASIAFVFLPRWLGSSSAHLILQTSFGGFIIQARGVAVESPYKIEPVIGVGVPSRRRLSRNFSLYNPFTDALHVEEVSAWVSLSGHTNQSVHVVCRMDPLQHSSAKSDYLSNDGWFRVESSKSGIRWLDIRPHNQWKVSAHKTEPILEMRLWPYAEGMILGAICLKLQSSTQDRTSTIVLPLELEVHWHTNYSDLSGSVSVDIESCGTCNGRQTVLIISLTNDGDDLLSLVNVSEITKSSKLFKVRYNKGLLLFPGTSTRIALISYSSSSTPQYLLPDIPTEVMECKLLIETNDSVSPVIKIPCLDLVYANSNNEHGSGITVSDSSYISGLSCNGEEKHTNAITGCSQSLADASFPMKYIVFYYLQPKLMEAFKADELILRNWRSQGRVTDVSVLEEHELSFPVVPVGTHFSKWISVHNPSQQAVIMQFVLNSGEVVDKCISTDELHNHTFLSRVSESDSVETRIGFSVSDSAVKEAFVHPSDSALFGPVVFRPLNRCMWRSSGLIQNNLSGVEWFPIRAFGGSHLLILLEDSEPVWKLEFNFRLPTNRPSADLLSHIENTSSLCNHRLSKEIYAKNIGELPLQVKKIKISGTDCALDGFTVHRCKDFALEPGESMKLLISYEADFYTDVVYRDLELAFATGIFVIPMKASLPVQMLNLCRKTFSRTVHWKVPLLIFAAVSIFLLLAHIIPDSFLLDTEEYYVNVDGNIDATNKAGKTSCLHHSTKFSRSSDEDENPKSEFVNEHRTCQIVVLDSPKRRQDKQDFVHQKEIMFAPPALTTKPVEVFDKYNLLEAPQSGNLTIRVGKDKGRRRKRRTIRTGLAAKLEVASGQSGNSTPTSPLSPNVSPPKQAWCLFPESNDILNAGSSSEQKHQRTHDAVDTLGTRVSETEKHYERSSMMPGRKQYPITPKLTGKQTTSPSVDYLQSVSNEPFVPAPSVSATHSPMAPHARAPGPRSNKNKAIEMEMGNYGVGKEYTYDIWGYHFSDSFLIRKPRMVDASEGDSESFFAGDPQSLMMTPSTWYVSPGQKLSSDTVSCHDQIK